LIDAATLERTIPFGPYECNVTAVEADILEEDWMRSKFLTRRHSAKAQSVYFPQNTPHNILKGLGVVFSQNFPQNMSPAALYPATSSKFTAMDGTSHDITCSSRTSTTSAAKATCPMPFQSSANLQSTRPCMQPCPAYAFSAKEYESFRLSIVIPGSIGLLTNTFMLL
jgi:hypothetical protein